MTTRGRHTEYGGDQPADDEYSGNLSIEYFPAGPADRLGGLASGPASGPASGTAGGLASGPASGPAAPPAGGGQPGDDLPTQQIDIPRDAFDDDLEQELAALAPRRIVTRTTLALAGIVLVIAGFLGGVYTQKQYGTSSTAAAPGAGSNRAMAGGPGTFPSGMAGGRQGQGAGASAAAGGTGGGTATTGKVKLVDGTTVYIETADGQVITVKTNETTTVQSAQSATLKDLAVGSQVTVEGSTSGSTVNATKVTKSK